MDIWLIWYWLQLQFKLNKCLHFRNEKLKILFGLERSNAVNAVFRENIFVLQVLQFD